MFLTNINNVYFAHSRRDIHLTGDSTLRGRAAQTITCRIAGACLTADIQGLRVRSQPGPIL